MTLDEIRELDFCQFNELLNEVQYQKAVDDYRIAHNFALLSCVVSGGRMEPEDLIGFPPKREGDKPTEKELFHLARQTRRGDG